MNKQEIESFVVLIGSRARGDATSRSDWDVLSIGSSVGHTKVGLPDSLVNVIDVPFGTFLSWHQSGSLFLQHSFVEGRLLKGDSRKWRDFQSSFNVQKSFRPELIRINQVTKHLLHPEQFGGKFLSPMVNAFGHLKNASIFYLAHNKRYIFNKSIAISNAVDDKLVLPRLLELSDFYDYSQREIDLALPFSPNDPVRAPAALRLVAQSIEGMCDAAA